MWRHITEVKHSETCGNCGQLLELRYIGLDSSVFYCHTCNLHHIKPVIKEQNGEVRK